MSVYDFYISPEEYDEARANGISFRVLNVRIRSLGWDKRRAMTQPLQRKTKHPELKKLAEENGICEGTFYARIRKGWDPEGAATTPLLPSTELALNARRKVPKEFYELAEKNGIPYSTFRSRIYQSGWEWERAATEPVWTHKQTSKYALKRFKEEYGPNPHAFLFAKRGSKKSDEEYVNIVVPSKRKRAKMLKLMRLLEKGGAPHD